MQGLIKTGVTICTILFSNIMVHAVDPILSSYDIEIILPQQDSIRIDYLERTLNAYQEELKNKSTDSVEIFKNIGLIHAELKQPKEASDYTLRYIKSSTDISILNRDSFNLISDTEEFDVLKRQYLPKGNILIYAYFFIAFLGFFFAVVINIKKGTDSFSTLLLGGFVVVHSLFILEFGTYASNLRYIYPHTYLMASSVALLYGPLLYFYFKRITTKYELKLKDLLHTIPAIVLLLILVPFYSLSPEEKIKIMFDISQVYSTRDFFYIVFFPKLSSYVIYGFLIGKLYFNNGSISTFKNDKLVKWKRNIYYIHVSYIVAYAFYGITISGILIIGSEAIYHFQVLAMSIMILYLAQMAYLNPSVFDSKTIALNNGLGFSKYLKSGLTPSLSEELKEQLIILFTVDKVYLDSSLNLETLSERLNTTRHNTSQIINEHFDMNFFELINKFRIDEAINLLLEDKNGNLNIIDIAYEVGYNNKVTFNKAFKKSTSLTPTQFIDSIKNGNLVNR